MITNSTIFVVTIKNELYRLEVDDNTQKAVCNNLSNIVGSTYNSSSSPCDFDPDYKLENDEYYRIQGYSLDKRILDAIDNPLQAHSFSKIVTSCEGKRIKEYPLIKYIFIGQCTNHDGNNSYEIIFQKCRPEQNLSTLPIRLFFSNNTFTINNSFGVAITDNVDCYYKNNELVFRSYHFAKQILDLKDEYRTATDADIDAFAGHKNLIIEDVNGFKKLSNTYIRRKIAKINDSKVLDIYPASEIKKLGKKADLNINLKDGKLVIPTDKNEAKTILAFLDEEAYKGPFSKDLLIANSKRVAKKK